MRARCAILRRSAARRARMRFLIALVSGFELAAFAGGCVSMVRGGLSNVAIFGEAIFAEAVSASAEAGALICSDAAEAESFAAGKTCSVAAIFVSLAEAGASAAAGAASLCTGLSATGISGFAVSGNEVSAGGRAAILSGSAGVEVIAAGSVGTAAAGTLSDVVS